MKLLANICLVSVMLFVAGTVTAQDFNRLREKMVNEQLANRDIKSQKVLDAMRKIERHLFVPEDFKKEAYNDYAVPIGEGQTISQPYIVAFMTQVLDIKPTDKILEIGTGSGYQAAVLAELCKEVYTIEIIQLLGERSAHLLQTLGYKNIFVKVGDGYLGWPEAAPFDAIIVTCSPSEVPKPLQDQLKEDGRMIIPVGYTSYQELILITKKNGKLVRKNVLPVLFVPMKDKKGKRY